MGKQVAKVTVTFDDGSTREIDGSTHDMICWTRDAYERYVRPHLVGRGDAATADSLLGAAVTDDDPDPPLPPILIHDRLCQYS